MIYWCMAHLYGINTQASKIWLALFLKAIKLKTHMFVSSQPTRCTLSIFRTFILMETNEDRLQIRI